LWQIKNETLKHFAKDAPYMRQSFDWKTLPVFQLNLLECVLSHNENISKQSYKYEVVSWLARALDSGSSSSGSSPGRGHFVLCSQARHSSLTVRFTTQVFKWVPPGKFNVGVLLRWPSILSRGELNFS